ncbi:AAA family ATPase [Anaerotruncus rubiinfantis]|uniref:AAA family ATPase n=1 Tax=Anaerotruncus rubiinfantis TaxID=1720200 RepID=UPI00189A5CAF|nr:AAA family ATPase [Anaerotruncus rubiinfantis]
MGKVARNSLKGYTYQQSVFILFLSIMDTERNISKIEVEALDTKNFDDMYFECISSGEQGGLSYRVQAKNYPDTSIEDVVIDDNIMTIKGNNNEFVPTDNNILIVNTTQICTTDTFMGFYCTKINNIIVIPLTPEQIAEKIDNMFSTEARELQIIHKADDITENAKFMITINELPELIQISNDLENETILLRNVPDSFERAIIFIEGKPGVGKSHFVNEILKKNPDAIVYRFWTGSQDPNKNRRIRFETFISELGIKVYGSAKKVHIDELVNTIQKDNRLVIIDGLDHVENYNPQQLEQFINFIDKLTNVRTVVLSRPLQHEIFWRKGSLLDWTLDETRVYLDMAYSISDYRTQQQIFHVSGGYPIITYFLAEDYKLNHRIDLTMPIAGINEYYDTLFVNNDRPSSAIGVFASGNCFFTWRELEGFFLEPEMYDVISEFIKRHPYLFKIILNRVSLIHDSFNTYLKTKIKSFAQRREKTISIIRKSLLSGSIEYMARMESFNFDEAFYSAMLRKYSHADSLTQLMLSTRDYNSINSLYVQLQRLLEDSTDVLDIYEYYSFALLFQIATRNDLIGCDSLVYQMLLYMHSHEGIEDNIFSSDYIWQVYLTCNGLEKLAVHYLTNRHMSDIQFHDLIKQINEDDVFYEKKDKVIKFNEFEAQLKDSELDSKDKKDALTEYLISIWIHGKGGDKFFDSFERYVAGDKESCKDLRAELCAYGLDKFWVDSSLSSAKYQLHELGFLGNSNKFRNRSLYDLILATAPNGSFEVVTLAASYLKLANYENREIDISNLAFSWSMYYNRKDYSVVSIDDALITFEAKNLIEWNQSFNIITRLMKQSEKGISHLLTSYVNKKGPAFVCQINETGYFRSSESQIRFWELNPEIYDCFSESEVAEQVMQLLSIYYYSKTIEGSDIRNIAASKYRDLVLCGIKHFSYSILSPDDDLIPILKARGVKYLGTDEKKETAYVPLQQEYIQERDFEYIAEQNIDYLEIAQYADGWYSCLPFVDVFSIYPKDDIQRDYNAIIHKSMFARVSDNDYIGNWCLLIGNIPTFLMRYEIDVDWIKLYNIFNTFLKLSLIYPAENQELY